MKKRFWEKRIPTILAYFVILLSIGVTSYLIQSNIITIGQASPETNPENIKITNITDISFTVSFTTKDKTTAAISFGETENLGSLAYDERDKTGNQNPYFSHYISVSNLKPNKKYFFAIVSNGNTFFDNEKKYIVTTGSKIDNPPPDQKPVYGKILLSDGTPAVDTLIYLNIEGAQPLSTLSKDNGEYIIPLNSIRNLNLDSYLDLAEDSLMKIEIIRENMKSRVMSLYKKENSIPTLTLTENYNFTSYKMPQDEDVSSVSSNLKAPIQNTLTKEVKILTPKENDSLIDQKPSFKGTGLPGKKIKITINSPQTIQAETTTDNNGLWTYRPTNQLTPGNHTITIETEDSNGIIKKITQSFSVYAAGTQVSEPATPSATPTISIPTPTNVIINPTMTIMPTKTPTPTFIVKPTNTITIEPPGDGITSILLSSASVLFIVAGAFFLFFI